MDQEVVTGSSPDPMDTFPPGVHVSCVFTTSIFGPMALAMSALGSALKDELIELFSFAIFAPVLLTGLMLVLATRGAVTRDRYPTRIKTELEIVALQIELFRDRSLRKSIGKLGLNPRPILAFRQAALVASLLLAIGSALVG